MRRARELDVVAGVGQIHVRQDEELHEDAEADYAYNLCKHRRADGRGKLRAEVVDKADEQRPAEEAKIHNKQLALVAGHDALAFGYALQRAHLRMLKQQIQRLAVAVERDKAGDNKQQRPQEDEYSLENVQPDNAEKHAERVEQVPVARLHAAHRAQTEDRKACADDQRHDLYGQIEDRCTRRGHSLVESIGKLIGIDLAVAIIAVQTFVKAYIEADAELLIHILELIGVAADELIRKEAEHREDEKIYYRGDNRLGSGSPYKGFGLRLQLFSVHMSVLLIFMLQLYHLCVKNNIAAVKNY